ncbi:hypothetical protein PPERSA_12055 [Pseudocohnilembus persalinus]|uniref:Ion transport domain-containing protein n=1 Tax=Pseudocohnilembus persalinus TaxID=266149 RepID=A0A0V0R8Y3_PSEPJ|nr:hypothetical protein PPERSA_12055 [Pseudocohnilembus persalinus]|eukprot:KRX10931.1 hypothetical protein PPERSA_12055 [Pseudocohnilembus persalinus]
MAYAFIAVVSFYFPVLSVLLMLSIFKKLNLAQDILLAVLKPWRSLLVVLLIFVIVSYYFALMAYYNYNEKYSPNCESFSGCFYFVIDNTFKTDGGFISMYEGILILLKKN